jgi:hypothetical protein
MKARLGILVTVSSAGIGPRGRCVSVGVGMAICLSFCLAGQLEAQRVREPSSRLDAGRQHRVSPEAARVERPTSTLVLGGAAGAGAGLLAGGVLGGALSYALTRCDEQDGCVGDYFNAAFNGAAVGTAFLIPLGVHLANDRQGSYTPALLASAGLGALGLGVFWGVQKSEGPDALMVASVVVTPALQLLTSVAIERATSRRRN